MKIKEEMKHVLDTFELDDVENYSQPIFEACLEYLNSNLLENVKGKVDVKFNVGFFDADRIAAYADKKNNEYVVKINMATWFIVYSFCHCCVMQPVIFEALSFREEMSEDNMLKYAKILTEMMMKVLFYHELGHIFNGHVDYIKTKETEYIKRNPKQENISENIFSYEGRKARPFVIAEMWQALEWNADDFSASRMIGQFTFDDNIEHMGLKGKEQGVFLLIVAYVAVFTLMEMGLKVSKPEEYMDKEHLPKRIRLNKCIESMYCAYREIHSQKISVGAKEVEKNFIPCIEQWVEEFMRTYFEDYDNVNLGTDINMEDLDEEHMSYYNQVDNYYAQNLMRELKPYAFCGVHDETTLLKGTILNLLSQGENENIDKIKIEAVLLGDVVDN